MAAEKRPVPATRFRQAVILWCVFFVLNVILNGTIPFAFGADMRVWTSSTAKAILQPLLIYGILFLVVPLILVKGAFTVRQPAFWVPLVGSVAALGLWFVFRGIGVVAVLVLAYLHWRFDLSELGIGTRGWRGDLVGIILPGLLAAIPALLAGKIILHPEGAFFAGVDRLLANPASSIENLFYFGFVAEGISLRAGKWITPILIAMMYTAHEMTNPEYWYESMNFTFVFVGIALITAIYLWRRNVVIIWLGDGFRTMLTALA